MTKLAHPPTHPPKQAVASTTVFEVWGDGEQTRSFMYVDDCVEGVLRIMMSETATKPLNLGTEEMVSMNKFAEIAMSFENKVPNPPTHPSTHPPRVSLFKTRTPNPNPPTHPPTPGPPHQAHPRAPGRPWPQLRQHPHPRKARYVLSTHPPTHLSPCSFIHPPTHPPTPAHSSSFKPPRSHQPTHPLQQAGNPASPSRKA